MQQTARYVLIVIAAVFLAAGGILLLRQWLNNEELALVLPCALAAIGAVLFGFGLFFPVGMFAEDKCSPNESQDSGVAEDVSVDPSEP